MKKTILSLVTLLACASNLWAEIKLPNLVGDNMVLQQATKVRLWGESTPNAQVTATNSWDQQTYQVTADAKGQWELWLQTPSATFEPQQVILSDGSDKVVLHDLLIGEVWFGSGQSNMEMPLRGFWNCPIEGGNQAIATAGKYRRSIR